jgi:hypothetical protein
MNPKSIIIISVIAIVFLVIFLKRQAIIDKIIPPADNTDTENEEGDETNNEKKKPIANDNFPLSFGSAGNRVKKLQHIVNKKLNSGLDEDGIWGTKTNKVFSKVLPSLILEGFYDNFLLRYEK